MPRCHAPPVGRTSAPPGAAQTPGAPSQPLPPSIPLPTGPGSMSIPHCWSHQGSARRRSDEPVTVQVLRVGTRGSALALAQSGAVAALIAEKSGSTSELVRVKTEGDVNTGPLAAIGGTGVFVTAVRAALADGRVDVVVHSFKDLPTSPAPGLTLAAVPLREDPADALCARDGHTL